jgi:hypothetical protein
MPKAIDHCRMHKKSHVVKHEKDEGSAMHDYLIEGIEPEQGSTDYQFNEVEGHDEIVSILFCYELSQDCIHQDANDHTSCLQVCFALLRKTTIDRLDSIGQSEKFEALKDDKEIDYVSA